MKFYKILPMTQYFVIFFQTASQYNVTVSPKVRSVVQFYSSIINVDSSSVSVIVVHASYLILNLIVLELITAFL